MVECFVVMLDFAGFLMPHEPPKRYGTWFESDELPWSDTRTHHQSVMEHRLSDQPTSSDTSNQGTPKRIRLLPPRRLDLPAWERLEGGMVFWPARLHHAPAAEPPRHST